MLLLLCAIALANGPSTDDAPVPEPVEVPTPAPAEPEPGVQPEVEVEPEVGVEVEPEPVVEPEPEPAAAVKLRVDADRSKVYALIYKKGAASAVSHDHVVEARQISGTATLDRSDPAASEVRIVVSVSGLFPDADEMRDQLGLPRSLSEKQRDEIVDHIFSEGQLFLEKYDKISFVSTAVSGSFDFLEVTGDFTLRGVTRSITVPMAVTGDKDAYVAKGEFRILQSDYGYAPYRALLGALQNKDEVDIVLTIRLTPAR